MVAINSNQEHVTRHVTRHRVILFGQPAVSRAITTIITRGELCTREYKSVSRGFICQSISPGEWVEKSKFDRFFVDVGCGYVCNIGVVVGWILARMPILHYAQR